MTRACVARYPLEGMLGFRCHFGVVLPAALALSVACGCESRERGPTGGAISSNAGDPSVRDAVVTARWPFWPVRMRLHPLTMITTDGDGKSMVDARVEFFDQIGDTVKGVTQFRFELHGEDPGETEGRPLRVWSDQLDLRDLERNRLHFDPVTRTYRFRLEVESEESARGKWLRCFGLSLDGRRFIARTKLR